MARTKQTARFHGNIGSMPTVMSLSGAALGEVVIRDPNAVCTSVHQPWQCSPGLEGFGESGGFVNWLRAQNPIIAGGLVLGLAVGTGLAVGFGTSALLDKGKPSRSLHGARRRRRRGR